MLLFFTPPLLLLLPVLAITEGFLFIRAISSSKRSIFWTYWLFEFATVATLVGDEISGVGDDETAGVGDDDASLVGDDTSGCDDASLVGDETAGVGDDEETTSCVQLLRVAIKLECRNWRTLICSRKPWILRYGQRGMFNSRSSCFNLLLLRPSITAASFSGYSNTRCTSVKHNGSSLLLLFLTFLCFLIFWWFSSCACADCCFLVFFLFILNCSSCDSDVFSLFILYASCCSDVFFLLFSCYSLLLGVKKTPSLP